MSVLIRVKDEPPGARPDYFRHALASTIAPYDLQASRVGCDNRMASGCKT